MFLIIRENLDFTFQTELFIKERAARCQTLEDDLEDDVEGKDVEVEGEDASSGARSAKSGTAF